IMRVAIILLLCFAHGIGAFSWADRLRCNLLNFAYKTSNNCDATQEVDRSKCPSDGVWSEWTTTGSCATTCGSCSNATRTRTCTNKCGDCPCTGPSEDVGVCGIDMCAFPNPTCCGPFVKLLNVNTGEFFCGTGNVDVTECKST
ncbi:hypothetical protein PENTCL1PPCAC_13308, partial [Pristionchus entomophagus]